MREPETSTEKVYRIPDWLADNYIRNRSQKKIYGAFTASGVKHGNSTERFGENAFVVKYWDESTFLMKRREWTDLLEESNCDRLFMSWEWHRAWWLEQKTDRSELCIIAVYEAGVLLALAPMYLEKSTYIRGLVPVRRLQFIGKRFRGVYGIRAEYMNFIVREDRSDVVLPVLIEAICKDRRWDELVVEDMSIDEKAYTLIASSLSEIGCHYRLDGCEPTYVIDCITSFDDYIACLGRNTRLRFYNRRKLLEQMGTVTLIRLNETNKQEFFEAFNEFHQQRWGRRHFPDQAQQFLSSVFSLESSGMSLAHSSLLKLDGRPVSVMLNALVNNRIYNIQLGYIEDFDKRISLGTLHLGYQIETAFNDKAILQFDFLAGKGKNANYKSQLAREYIVLLSMRWSRSFLLRCLFAVLDKFRRIFPDTKLS